MSYQTGSESLLYLFADTIARVPSFEFGVQLRSDYRHQFFVMSHKGAVEITAAKHQRVAVSLKAHTAAKVPFKQFAMLHRSSQFQPKGCDLPISAPATHIQNP